MWAVCGHVCGVCVCRECVCVCGRVCVCVMWECVQNVWHVQMCVSQGGGGQRVARSPGGGAQGCRAAGVSSGSAGRSHRRHRQNQRQGHWVNNQIKRTPSGNKPGRPSQGSVETKGGNAWARLRWVAATTGGCTNVGLTGSTSNGATRLARGAKCGRGTMCGVGGVG